MYLLIATVLPVYLCTISKSLPAPYQVAILNVPLSPVPGGHLPRPSQCGPGVHVGKGRACRVASNNAAVRSPAGEGGWGRAGLGIVSDFAWQAMTWLYCILVLYTH